MRKYLTLASVALALWASAALAQNPTLQWIDLYPSGLELSTTPVNCAPADASRKTLTLTSLATNTTNGLYCFRAAATPNTACTPLYTIMPNEKLFWPYGSAPLNAMDCAAASATPTIGVSYEK